MQGWALSADWFFAWLWRASWEASVVIALVALVQVLFQRQLGARWSHWLWLLVIIRLALPWSVESRLSLFNWLKPAAPGLSVGAQSGPAPESTVEPTTTPSADPPGRPAQSYNWWRMVHWVWLAGAVLLLVHLFWTSRRLNRAVHRLRPVTEGAVLDLLEDCKEEMGVRTPLSLIEAPNVSSPALLGFIRPRLLVPAGLTQRFSRDELRYVFLHELAHLKRSDIPLNWLTSLVLILHWFNPLVWYAFSRLRADRELACDALALAHTRDTEHRPYGETILKLLEHFTRPTIAPGVLGILENKTQIQRRISMIAKFRKSSSWPILAGSLAASLALVTLTDPKAGQAASETAAPAQPKEGPPRIIATSPKVGETEVSPSITEITVTFDRDMSKGFSWTGSGPDYPPGAEGQKVHWRDKRTCVFPVKLQGARYYRVGINSTSYQNFQSEDGVPAHTSAIYFTTVGASQELKRKVSKPFIVGLEPKNGCKDVDAGLKELRVTFSVPMGGGFSWTGSGAEYPTIPEGKKPFWTEDKKTCVLPVELQPGHEYHLGLNSPSHKNFQSAGGVPLDPIAYSFSTK